MNDYDLLGLMDTWKAMKASGIKGLPTSFAEALTGLTPVDTGPITIPQITQGNTTEEQAKEDVRQLGYTARDVTNNRGGGELRVPLLGELGGRRPTGQHKVAAEQEKRLKTREELGF